MQLSLRGTLIPKVYHFTLSLSIIFCLVHLMYTFLFLNDGVTLLVIYELVCSIFYMIICLLYKNSEKNVKRLSLLLIGIILEVTIHLSVMIIFVGIDSKFSHFLYGVYIFILFENYISSNKNKTLVLLTITSGIFFLTMHLIAKFNIVGCCSSSLVEFFGIVNPLLTIVLFVIYVLFFTTIIYDFEKNVIDIATRDALTGVRNRTLLSELNYSSDSIVAILDVDNFKKINDKYGHDIGDKVLITLGNSLLQLEAKYEELNVMRWGGEEFVIYFEGSINDFLSILERLHQEIHQSKINVGYIQITYSVTIGVSDSTQGYSIEELISKADINLYQGKVTGKDKIVY